VPGNSSDYKVRGKEKLNKLKHAWLAHYFKLKEKNSELSLMEQVTLIKVLDMEQTLLVKNTTSKDGNLRTYK
jgi:hypothetical protein